MNSILEMYGLFLYSITLPAITIFVGLELFVAIVKYFKGTKSDESAYDNKALKFAGVAILHTVSALLSPIPTSLVILMVATVYPNPGSVFWIFEVAVNVGFIFLLKKLIGWLAKPLDVSFALPNR